ncbi:MAG: hypothetical protein C4325_08885 [Blastocatellia bacterium]
MALRRGDLKMRVALSELKMPAEFEADLEVSELSESARPSGRFHLAAVIKGNESFVEISGSITGDVILQCSRCLNEKELPISIRVDLSYVQSELFALQDGHQLTSEELSSDEIIDGGIEIDDMVLEQVVLALPQQFVCSEECPGLCTFCGAELKMGDCGCKQDAFDPRWDALTKLK